ncbi:type II toxin-antitoxin system VapC family toxin [Microlunatus spumicola]|uniref:Ribonuclease VapC n=1 Tax=Microlunatus spumicola TaxID=81499 RepID=A0ABP6WU69_9ACTN
MIGLDTNVLVRYVVVDDPVQVPLARELMESLTPADPAFVSLVTLVELTWVLRQGYRLSAADVRRVVGSLLSAKELVVERADLVARALTESAAAGTDVADALVAGLGRTAGCAETVTFDRRAARLPGMRLLD